MLDLRDIEKELDRLVDPEYQQGLSMSVPTEWKIRGIRVPELKRIAREQTAGKKTEEGYREAVDFLDEAFRSRDRELAIIGINALYGYRKFFDAGLAARARVWAGEVSDWEICDNLSYLIIDSLLEKGLFGKSDLLFLRDHPNLFARRAFLVSRVKALREGRCDTDEALADIAYFAEDRQKYMVKAVSWALREATKSEPGKVSEFLAENRERLHPSVVREVNSKLEKGTKR